MLKDLIVHLDGTEEDNVRLAQAEAIGLNFKGHLIGLYTNPLPEYAYVLAIQSGLAPMGPVIEIEQQIRKEGDVAVGRLNERFKKMAGTNEVRRIDAGVSELPGLCASQARWADLFVATTPYRSNEGWDALVEAVLFESGHAIYVVPEQFKVRGTSRNILVAWCNTRESARAFSEAIPFLRAATTVRLVTVETADGSDRPEDGANIAPHLSRHGINSEIRSVEAAGRSVSEVLLSEAHKMDADLIVMGAYGHSRLREWVLGGTTREMITGSDIPILIAH